MLKLNRFVGTCLLVVSMAAIGRADGGDTQGPNLPSPQPAECTTNCDSQTTIPAPDSIVDTVAVGDALVIWLVESIR
jgi:hypothetical protein